MSVELWWNDRPKDTYSEENLYRCKFVHHKCHSRRLARDGTAVTGGRLNP